MQATQPKWFGYTAGVISFPKTNKNFEINIFYKLQTGNPQNKTNMKYENIDYLIV